ncbi:hypothetical protein LguiA_017729 [Lonicera macranthoides]
MGRDTATKRVQIKHSYIETKDEAIEMRRRTYADAIRSMRSRNRQDVLKEDKKVTMRSLSFNRGDSLHKTKKPEDGNIKSRKAPMNPKFPEFNVNMKEIQWKKIAICTIISLWDDWGKIKDDLFMFFNIETVLMPFQPDKAVVWCKNEEEAERITSKGALFVDNFYSIKLQDGGEQINVNGTRKLACTGGWIKIMDLPLKWWRANILKAIGEECGGLLEIDDRTASMDQCFTACIKVIGKPNGFTAAKIDIYKGEEECTIKLQVLSKLDTRKKFRYKITAYVGEFEHYLIPIIEDTREIFKGKAPKQAWQTLGKDDNESRSEGNDELTNPNSGDIAVRESHQNWANDTGEDGRLGLVFPANSRVGTHSKSCLEMGDRLDVPDIIASKRESGEGENNYWVRGSSLFTKGEIFRANYFPSQETALNTGNRKRILRHDDIEETNEDFIMIKNFDPLAAISRNCECKRQNNKEGFANDELALDRYTDCSKKIPIVVKS